MAQAKQPHHAGGQPSASASASDSSAQAASPDVAAWTSHLVVLQHQEAAQARTAAREEELSSQNDVEFGQFAGSVLEHTSTIAGELTRNALRFLGTPYVFGGTSPGGFDCSGYVQHVFAMLGIYVPRTADAQYYEGRPAIGGPQPGDLVFFQTYLPGPSHVGIYLGNGQFVHASSHGVMVSNLSESYWASRYLGAKRMLATR
ncbi:MAG: C40 family peptidase [Vulcanimicrobiaceae bacterium]